MDRLAFEAAHAALGNASAHTAIEISLGALILQCKAGAVTLAITGGDFTVEHAEYRTSSWTILTLRKGEQLAIRAGKAGSWAYLAFAGTLQASTWLDSTATHAASGFGGGALLAGQRLIITETAIRNDREGSIARPVFFSNGPIRVVPGPQDHHFVQGATERFLSEKYKITDAYDRMGMRLEGPTLELDNALSIPSEPIVRGSVQVSGDGVPTVLLADHQTTGGYPKIATVISCDTDPLTQLRTGQTLSFASISSQEAIAAARAFSRDKTAYLEKIGVAQGSLEQRLMRENLIHGCLFTD